MVCRMDIHICLILDADDAIIKSTTIVDGRPGADIRRKARTVLNETPGGVGFELWRDGDRIDSYFPRRN